MRTRRGHGGAGGFTLIEALVALSIFSFIGVAAYQLLSSTSRLRESGETRFRAVSGLQLAMRQLDEDFSQFAARPIPTGRGEHDAALDTEPADAEIEFTRAGWRNPLGLPRASLQRVAWILDDENRLLRRYRLNLDDADPEICRAADDAWAAGRFDRPTLGTGETRALGNLASVAFGGPDLRTVHLGSLANTRLATFRSPVAGAMPHHWSSRPAFGA